MFGFGTRRAALRKRGSAGSGAGSNGVSATSFNLYSASSQAALPSGWSIARSTQATYFDGSGSLQMAASDIARMTHEPASGAPLGLLIEPASVNEIRNNTMLGAVIGSPGTLPSNWSGVTSLNGLDREIVGSGTANGITYIDIRYSGTTTGSFVGAVLLNFESSTQVPASSGQTWTTSAYVALVGGSLANISAMAISTFGTSSGGGLLEKKGQSFTPTAAWTRISATHILGNGSTAHALPAFEITIPTGVTVDFTLRIGLPQIEQADMATSSIPTSGSSVARGAEKLAVATTSASTWIVIGVVAVVYLLWKVRGWLGGGRGGGDGGGFDGIDGFGGDGGGD